MIRRGRPDDVDSIAALFRRSFATLTFLPTLHTPEEDRRYFAKVLRESDVWVAEEGDRMLGFAVLSGDMLAFLYVEPVDHGRGTGSALLDAAKAARPDGFRFWVFQKNDRARRFYKRHGCEVVKLTDGAGNEEREPDALYEWRPAAARP